MEIYEKLGEIIRNQRQYKKVTMKELAEKVGVTESAIHHYEMGVRKMDFELFGKVCKVLDLDASEVAKEILK